MHGFPSPLSHLGGDLVVAWRHSYPGALAPCNFQLLQQPCHPQIVLVPILLVQSCQRTLKRAHACKAPPTLPRKLERCIAIFSNLPLESIKRSVASLRQKQITGSARDKVYSSKIGNSRLVCLPSQFTALANELLKPALLRRPP